MKHFNADPEPSHTSTALVRPRDLKAVPAQYNGSYNAAQVAPYGSYEGSNDSESGGLGEYWRIVRLHKNKLILCAIGGTLLGVAVGIPWPPIYKAHTTLEVLSVNEDFMKTKETSPVTAADSSFDTSEEETQAQLLQSNALIERVIDRLDPQLAHILATPRTATSWWRKLINIPDPPPLTHHQKLLLKVSDSLRVQATPRTRVLDVTAKSTDARVATDFLNMLTAQFIERSLEERLKTSQTTGDWLTKEIDSERVKLERSEDALQTYARESGLIFTDENTDVATEKLQQLQQMLSKATADRIAKQSRFELAKNSPPDSLPNLLDDQSLRDTADEVATLQGQVANLNATYGPDYSKLKQAQAQLVPLQEALNHTRESILRRIANDYEEAQRKEGLLAADYEAQTTKVTQLDAKAVQYNILKREADSNRQLYDTMLLQAKQSSIAAALHASNVHVVDPAETPGRPIWPNFPILAVLGFMTGLFSGVCWAVILERTDRTIQQPGEMQLWTNLLELGAIPNASVEGEKKRFMPNNPTLNGLSSGRGSENGSSLALTTWEHEPGPMAEAFRSTLTSILFVGENGSRPNVLVVTSASPGEGKTTVVSNLAIAMAEARRRVLIIDADLRRPRMDSLFQLSNKCGLTDLLREKDLSSDFVDAMIHETQIPGLSVLPSGPPTQAVANLLYSPNLEILLARFKEEYDLVLIDTPPMLHMTDARIVGRLADAVVLVARAQHTTRDAILAAHQRLSEDQIRVLGTVLNGWDPKSSAKGYYGYYARSHYYAPNYSLPEKDDTRFSKN